MNQKNSNKKLMLFGVIGFVLLLVILLLLYNKNKETTVIGSKKIVAEVILLDGTSTSHEIQTDEEYLRGALTEINLIIGTESEYGLYVQTVNGVTADEANQEWWAFSKNGEALMTGVDDTPISDGDHFEIILTAGY